MNGLLNNIWNKKSASGIRNLLSFYVVVNISVVINNYLVYVKINILVVLIELIIGIYSIEQ